MTQFLDKHGLQKVWTRIKSYIDTKVATKTTLSAALLAAHPVGSIYMSTLSTNPHDLFGGTWVRVTGRFLLGCTDNASGSGASYSALAYGGEATHALTPAETATKAHTHTINHNHSNNINFTTGNNGGGHTHAIHSMWAKNKQIGTSEGPSSSSESSTTAWNSIDSNTGKHGHTLTKSGGVTAYSGSSGSLTAANGSAHNNMPPFFAVYIWRRTA